MKNYQSATAEEIIERQLALANFKESTAQSFYNKERIGFLNKFYEYCKANEDKFEVKWSQWKKAAVCSAAFPVKLISDTTLNYIKNPVVPGSLYVVSLDYLTLKTAPSGS